MACALLGLLSGCPRGPRGGDPTDPKALLEAAQKADRTGRLAAAERLWTKVLRGARARGEHPLRLRAALALSRVALDRGQVVVGRVLLGQELARAKKADNRGRLAVIHAALGDLDQGAGRLGDAHSQYRWAALYAKAAGLRAVRARAIARQAGLRARRGDFDGAVEAMAQVVMLLGGLRGVAAARAALAAGRSFALLADHKRARRYLGRAQREFEAQGRVGSSGDVSLDLARLAVAAGDQATARRSFQQALARLAQVGALRRHARAAWWYARVLDGWGEHRQARQRRGLARRSLRALGDGYGEAMLDLDAARSSLRRRRFRDAATRLRRAVPVLEKAADRFSSGEARILLGRARVQLGQAAEAVGELSRALDHTAAVIAPELSWRAYALLGFLTDTLLDREDKAAGFHRGAVAALERVRAGLDLIGGGDAAAEDNAYYELARIHIKQWRRGLDPKHVDAALASLERGRSRRMLDLLTRAGASLADTRGARAWVRTLSGEERAIAERLAAPGSGLALRRLLYKRLQQIRVKRAQLEGQALRFAAAHPAPVNVSMLKSALTDKGAVLIYHVGQRSSLLLGFNSKQSKVVNLPGRAELTRLVGRYTSLLFGKGEADLATLRQRGAALTQKLWAPVSSLLVGRTRIRLVLSGPLWRLPFAALPQGRRGWLGQQCAFVRVPSPAVWLKLKATPRGLAAKQELLAVARVQGDAQGAASPVRAALLARGHGLGSLPGARKRAKRVVAAVGEGRARILSGGQGSEAALRKHALTDYRRLHFAARLLLPARILGPVQPALVLAGDASSDGLLLLRELLGLSLDADLVSIEGLELGRGAPDWQGPEGVARALLLAGARSVVLPLASPTRPTADAFFTALYKGLVKGADKATAWRAVQTALRANRATRHPRHFATYVLYGAL